MKVEIVRNAMTPRTDDAGKPKHIGPYLPVLRACDVCPARCCKSFAVELSLPDAVRFMDMLGLPFWAGLRVLASTNPHAFAVEHDERMEHGLHAFAGTAHLALRRTESGACGMLVDIGGFERCGVYAARPAICRLYPLTWTSETARGGPGAILCPVPYAVTDAAERRFTADVEAAIAGWELHDEIVAQLGPAKPLDAFLKEALAETARRMGVSLDVESALSSARPDARLYASMRAAKVVR